MEYVNFSEIVNKLKTNPRAFPPLKLLPAIIPEPEPAVVEVVEVKPVELNKFRYVLRNSTRPVHYYQGECINMYTFKRLMGISSNALAWRMKKGLSFDEIAELCNSNQMPEKAYSGRRHSLDGTVYKRKNGQWEVDEILTARYRKHEVDLDILATHAYMLPTSTSSPEASVFETDMRTLRARMQYKAQPGG